MEGAVCKQCAADGRKTILCLFQINLEEAVWMCPSKECTFPMGTVMTSDILVRRNLSEITNLKRRKVKVKRPRPVSMAPQLAHSTIALATNLASMVTVKRSSMLSSSQASMKAAESKSPVVAGTSDVNMSQKHSSYIADRRHRTDTASPATSDSSQLTSSVPSPTEGVFSPTTNTDSATLPVLTNSCAGHCTAKAEPSSAVNRNPGLVSLLSCQVKPVVDSTIVRPRRYLQWSNVDALCWMDVALCLLVHCTNLKEQVVTSGGVNTSLVRLLLARYKEILALWDSIAVSTGASVEERKRLSLETSVGKVSVKTGGGGLDHLVIPPMHGTGANRGCSPSEKSTPQCVMKSRRCESGITLDTACRMLADIRDEVLACRPKLLRERGHNHSPVFALPLLLGNDDQAVHSHFCVEYCWRMRCTQCHYCHEDRVAKTVLTFPAVPNDFSMEQPRFLRPCFRCHSPGQSMNMHIERMPSTLLVHFVEGLFDPQLTNYDFQFGATPYAVTGLVQYKTKPDHFIAWIRDVRSKYPANCWMMCDDLQNPICEFTRRVPSFPPSQVHIVMWERQSHPVMDTVTNLPRDTGVATGVPGVIVLAAPVILSPAIVTNTSGVPPQPVTSMTVSPVGFVAPVGPPVQPPITSLVVPEVTGSSVVHSHARTTTSALTDRLQRCREKFERAKAIRQRVPTSVLPPTPPAIICVSTLPCRQRQTNLLVQSTVSPLAVTATQAGDCGMQVSLGTHVLSSQKPRGTVTVPSSGVKTGVRVVRAMPVFAGYTAKALAHKQVANRLNATENGANSLGGAKCDVNTSSSANSGANTLSSANSGANTLSSVNSGANTLSSANSGVNTLSSMKSGVACTNTAVKPKSKKRVISRQSDVSGKRRKLSILPTPPVVSQRVTKCVTRPQTQPETVGCPSMQSCDSTQVDTTNSGNLADVLDELCSTLNMSDVSQQNIPELTFDCDDIIDFDSLLAV